MLGEVTISGGETLFKGSDTMMCRFIAMEHARRRSGQSLVEYAVVLALIAIVTIAVVTGVGQTSKGRMALVNQGLEEQSVAGKTPPPVVTTGKLKPKE